MHKGSATTTGSVAAATPADVFAAAAQQVTQQVTQNAANASLIGAAALHSQVLVLNRMWMAVRVVDAKRAFTLLAKQAAEVIRVDDGSFAGCDWETWADVSSARGKTHGPDPQDYDWVRTVHAAIAVPKIIRLLGYDRLPAQDVKLNRRNIYARDRNRCQYCGKHYPVSELSLDHVTPRSQGGVNSWTNLVCCCVKCNARKGGRTPEQAKMALVKEPRKPRRNPSIAVRLGSSKYQSWKQFLDNAYWSVELR